MGKPTKPGIHAMKLTARPGRVKMVSLAFDGPRVMDLSNTFKWKLRQALSRQSATHGRYRVIDAPGRADWYFILEKTWPEAELNQVLNKIATELDGWMYMSPAIPLQQVTADPSKFLFVIDPSNTHRTN